MSEGGPFDEAIVLDWSAASSPTTGPDSCWTAMGPLHGPRRTKVTNFATRAETVSSIRARLNRNRFDGRRTFVAVDVSFGFAAGAADLLRLEGSPPWRALWTTLEERISDDERNTNNRFAVADALNASSGVQVFWGRPASASFDHLTNLSVKNVAIPGLARNPLPRLRLAEERAGGGVISNWMLVGKGSVGGQILTCLPYLERLRAELADAVGVWPFDGPGDPGTDVVLAETWFALFDWHAARGAVRDEQQVRGTFDALRQLSASRWEALLSPATIARLDPARRREILTEEGWTFGVE